MTLTTVYVHRGVVLDLIYLEMICLRRVWVLQKTKEIMQFSQILNIRGKSLKYFYGV